MSAPQATSHRLRRAIDRQTARCATCRGRRAVRQGPARAATARGAAGASPAAWAGAADRATRGTRRCSDTTPTSRPSRDGLDRAHQSVSSVSRGVRGISRISATFFGRAMIVSARCSFRWSLRFSASNCFTRGSIGRGVGPRRRPRMSRRAPCSRCRRQFATCELYKPSRRSSAPSSPGRLHASACLRMRSRYSAVNRRRWAFAGTSGSGAVAGWWHAIHPLNPPRPDTNLNKEVVS